MAQSRNDLAPRCAECAEEVEAIRPARNSEPGDVSLHIVAASNSEHQLGHASARDLGGYLLAKLVGDAAHRGECGIGLEIVASRAQGHEDSGRAGRRHDRGERELGDPWIVELRERVGQCIEHLPTQLQILVVAFATTFFVSQIAPRRSEAAPNKSAFW